MNKNMLNKENNFLNILSYICVSDYDTSYFKTNNLKKVNFFKWVYFIVIVWAIFITLIPLFFNSSESVNNSVFVSMNLVALVIFLMDYALRWITYPARASDKSKLPLLFFPLSGISFILILSIIPSIISVFSPLFKTSESNTEFIRIVSTLVIFRLGRLLLLLNILPAFRIMKRVFFRQRVLLWNVLFFLLIVTILFALVIFRAEIGENPNIHNYWDAFYFTVITITTIGYGDIVPVTAIGRAMDIVLAIIGVALFTIPSGIIAGGFITEMKNKYEDDSDEAMKKRSRNRITLFEKTLSKTISKSNQEIKKNFHIKNDKKDKNTNIDTKTINDPINDPKNPVEDDHVEDDKNKNNP